MKTLEKSSLNTTSLKILVIILSILVLLLTCSTIFLLGQSNSIGDSTQTNKPNFPIKTLCDKDYANTFCKIVYNYEPSNQIKQKNQEIEDQRLFFNNLEIVANEFASAEKMFSLNCDIAEAYKNNGCPFIVGVNSFISFSRSEERDGDSYNIYSVTTSYYHDSPTETKFYELNNSTKQVTDVTEREFEAEEKRSEEENQNAQKAIKAIKEFLKITEDGVYKPAEQIPASYTFDDGSFMELTSTHNNSYVVATYVNLSQEQRFLKFDLSSLIVTEITQNEWKSLIEKLN